MSELSDRLRSRILEVLALVADADAQRKYQASVPHVDVPAELFSQWEENFFPANDEFQSAFSDAELEALRRFDVVVNGVSAQTPKQLPVLETFGPEDRRRLALSGDHLARARPDRCKMSTNVL